MKTPFCQNKSYTVSIRGKGAAGQITVKPHPRHAWWDRKYKSAAGWIIAHPGEPVGRDVTPRRVYRRRGCFSSRALAGNC